MFTPGEILLLVVIFFSLYTSIFFLFTTFENWGSHKTIKKLKDYPTVTIVIPCYNEEKTVAKTIESLLKLDYPKDKLDIIVVDDGSKDDTFNIALKYKDKGVRVFRKKNGGKYTALNYGIKKSNSEFFGGLDADSIVHPKALKRILTYFDNPEIMAVTPSMLIYNPKGFLSRIQSIEYIIGVFLRRVFTDLGSQHVTPGPFSIYRMDFFKKYGPYREAFLTEDIELALRIQSNHYQIANATDAYVYTSGLKTFRALYKQRLRWYYGFLRNILSYKSLFSKEHGNLGLFVLPISFLSIGLMSIVVIYTLSKFFYNFFRSFYNYFLINFDISKLLKFNFDLFFVNLDTISLLGFISLFLLIVTIILGKHFSKEKNIFFSSILFALFYVYLYILWWWAAIFKFITGRKVSWGHKSEVKKEIT